MSKLIIGIPKEIKVGEKRVGLTPENIKHLKSNNRNLKVLVQKGAGTGSGFTDKEYEGSGAELTSKANVWRSSRLIVKVKEPVKSEYQYLKNKIIYGYFHLNSPHSAELNEAICATNTLCIPYEDIVDGNHRPCLAPMSVIAGRLASQKGAQYLESLEGMGKLMGGVPGTEPANVLVVGGGVSGLNAAKVAAGMGANVTIADVNRSLLDTIWHRDGMNCVYSDVPTLSKHIKDADLVIGAVLIPGKSAPKVITSKMLSSMKPGSVVVDIAIDEGGCTEWSSPTTHASPVFKKNGVLMYCVTNMPALAPITSTQALTNATVPYLEKIIEAIDLPMRDSYDASLLLREYGISSVYEGLPSTILLKG